MYQYLTYGICVHSDIMLYNLPQTEGYADVVVHYGDVGMERLSPDEINFYYSPMHTCFCNEYGFFSIKNGNEIIVQTNAGVEEHKLAAYILGMGFAFLFTQRGFSALHCTALDVNGRGVLISGISGSGKSTTALSLIQRGHKYLVDDIAMINPLCNMNIIPAYPLQKVCRDISKKLNTNKLLYINEERDKYAYFNIDEYCGQPRELHTLVLLKAADTHTVHVEEITGLNKYLKVLECLFLAETYLHTGTPNEDKFRCLKIAEKIRLYVITRPLQGDTIEEIASIIENLGGR